jgi:hypothetical protein
MSTTAPYVQATVLAPKPKEGSQPGTQEEGWAVDVGEFVGDVEDDASACPGVGLTGRVGASLGFDDGVGGVTGLTVVVPTSAVVTGTTISWSLSSFTVGMGRRVALEASIDSPQSLRRQSQKVPVSEFSLVS